MLQAHHIPRRESTELVPRATIESLVLERDAAIAAYDGLIAAKIRLDTCWTRATGQPENLGCPGNLTARNIDTLAHRKKLDAACWKRIVRISGIDALMHSSDRDTLGRQLETDPPCVTIDTVYATLDDLMTRSEEIFRQSVVSVFESLPRKYRSNDGFKYGDKIVLAYGLENFGGTTWSLRWGGAGYNALMDLDRIFHVLNRNPGDSFNQSSLDACHAVEQACQRPGVPFAIETRYFKIKGFKKGTLHIVPNNQDLCRMANAILAGHYGSALGWGSVPNSRQKTSKAA